MKSFLSLLMVMVVALSFLVSCNPASTESKAEDTVAVAGQDSPPVAQLVTMCMLNEVGIRDTPGEKGKYLTTLYLSERVVPTGDTASVVAGGKKVSYHKIRMEDGKEGWVKSDFIAINVTPGVFKKQTSINKRPDFSAVTGKNFEQMDLVAMREPKNGWVEVTGIPTGDKWFTTGYVHQDNLSTEPIDVSFSAIYHRAFASTDQKKKEELMNLLSSTADFQQSSFYETMFGGEEVEEDPLNATSEAFAVLDMDQDFDDSKQNMLITNHNVTSTQDRFNRANEAAYFNGTSAYLSASLIPDNITMSYTMWVKADKLPKESTLLGMGNNCTSGYAIMTNDNATVDVLCGGVMVEVTKSTYALPVGQWVFVALVKQENTFSLYINGELSSEGTSSYNDLTSSFIVGAGNGCNGKAIGGFFEGSIDDVQVFERALSGEEVATIFLQQK